MPFFFPIILGALGAGASYLFASNKKDQVEQAWGNVATALGLKYTPAATGVRNFGTIYGAIRGVRVTIDVNVRGSGDSRAEYTRCRLDFPSGASGNFTMSKQSSFSFFATLFGRQDVQIGDPAFDSKVVIDATDPVAVNRYLTPARRMAIIQMMQSYAFVEIRPTSSSTEMRGVESNPAKLEAWIRYLVDVALVLDAPSDVDLALEKQQRGDLADAVDSLHELNDVQDGDPNSFTQFLEAEALVAMGEGKKASKILDDLPVFDPVLGEWKTVAKKHPKPVELKPISTANLEGVAEETIEKVKPQPSPAVSVPIDQRLVIADLFDSDRLSYEVEQHFFDTYEGSIVEWSGTVGFVRNFRSDRDFVGTGVKATVEIGSYGEGRLLSKGVNAIVHLPEGTTVEPGDTVSFRGSFIRTDRYMNNLFVANAEVL